MKHMCLEKAVEVFTSLLPHAETHGRQRHGLGWKFDEFRWVGLMKMRPCPWLTNEFMFSEAPNLLTDHDTETPAGAYCAVCWTTSYPTTTISGFNNHRIGAHAPPHFKSPQPDQVCTTSSLARTSDIMEVSAVAAAHALHLVLPSNRRTPVGIKSGTSGHESSTLPLDHRTALGERCSRAPDLVM